MHAAAFARQRARIERKRGRSAAWRKRAIQRLVEEANARPVVIRGELAAFLLPDGSGACTKGRYRTSDAANDDLAMIVASLGEWKKPCRAYHCPFCRGWHLTSKAA